MFQALVIMTFKGVLTIWFLGAFVFLAIRISHYIFKPRQKLGTLCNNIFTELPGLLGWPLMLMSSTGRKLFKDIFFK